MSNLAGIIPLIATLSAALIAALVSFLVAVLSKEQKVSEFRQSWIDALRSDIADFDSHVGTLISFLGDKSRDWSETDLTKFLDGRYNELRAVELLHTRILLRLNPQEHNKLIQSLSRCRAMVEGTDLFSVAKANEASKALVEETQSVLKLEWRRVKRGEPVFVAVKYGSILVALVVATIGSIYALRT